MKKLIPYITPIVLATFLNLVIETTGNGQILRPTLSRTLVNSRGESRPDRVLVSSVSTTNVLVSYTDDSENYSNLISIDLSNAYFNPVLGRYEVQAEIDHISSTGVRDFVSATTVETVTTTTTYGLRSVSRVISTNIVTSYNLETNYQELDEAQLDTALSLAAAPTCGLAGIIIGILVLIVAGIIIYILIKTCKKLLPDKENS